MRRDNSISICWLTVVLLATLVAGCSDDGSEPTNPVDGGDAYEILENLLFSYQETYDDLGDADRPGDFDFRPALEAYQAAYDDDTADPTARFGLAATKLLSVAADSRVNQAFDAWKDYIDTHVPFEVATDKRSLSLPLGLPGSAASFDLPFMMITSGAMASVKAQLAGDEPLVSDVQDILATVLLPAVESSIALLTPVAALDDFVFPISPLMQGSAYEDPLELDRVEVMAMLAACKLLQAGIGIAVAYDVQFASYDAEGMFAGLNPDDGNVGVLLPGGAARMQQAPSLFLEAVDIVDQALDVLQAESQTDPDQDDDIIKIGPSDIDQDDIDAMQAEDLPDLRGAFSAAGVLRTENWDASGSTPDATIRINLRNFFETPVEDFKALLPAYELVIGTGAADHYEQSHHSVSMSVPGGGVWYPSYHVEVEDGEVVDSSSNAFPDFDVWCEGWVAERLEELRDDPTWSGSAYFGFYSQGEYSAGTQMVNISISDSWSTAIAVPEIHWDAQTFAAWTQAMPDPTLSGLLPEMSAGADLCATFGIVEDDWDPVMIFDWWDGDFGDDDSPIDPGRLKELRP